MGVLAFLCAIFAVYTIDRALLGLSAKPFESPVWVDLLTGNAYEIPAAREKRVGDKHSLEIFLRLNCSLLRKNYMRIN